MKRVHLLLLSICFVLLGVAANAQTMRASGTVRDAQGEPILGASIVEEGTQNGTTSDSNGTFALTVKPGAYLTISFIGFEEQRVQAAAGMTITLTESSNSLDEVVVIGYGAVRKKDLTGSVFQIRPESMQNESPSTVQDLLRSVPGLSVGMTNDAKGSASLNIRGQRSVYTGGGHNDPLIILDGMQFYGELSEINPEDIAQIDVLKDASSAAVYGAKAANGVIIITSKKGRQGKPTVSFNANFGITTRADYERYFTPEEYVQHKVDYFESLTAGFNEATGKWDYYQAGQTNYGYYRNPSTVSDVNAWRSYTSNGDQSDKEIWVRRLNFKGNLVDNYLAGKTVDWYDYVYRTGFRQDYNVSVGGATDKANYYASAGYLKNEGVVIGNNYRSFRLSMRTNMDVTNWLSLGAKVNFQDRSDGDKLSPGGMMDNSPYADDKDENGNWLQYPLTDPEYTQRGNAAYFSDQFTKLEKGYVVANGQFDVGVKLPWNIKYEFHASPRYQFFYDRYFMSADEPGSNPKSKGVNRQQAKNFDWTLNNIITWNQTFAEKHDLTVTLVQEAEERRYWSDRIEARNIQPTDALGFHSVTGAVMADSNFSVSDNHQTADGMLARLQYVYDDRYLLTASVRRDGYSAFGAHYPHATFPSVAAAWTFTNEKFWKYDNVMDYGKLRLSWGKNGNRSLADPYLALANLTTGQYAQYFYDNAVQDMTYLRVDRLANPNLQWEKSTAYNVGVDFSFIGSRITGSLDFYLTQTHDMIMDQRLPGFSGFDHITTNLGQVDNKGIELNIVSKNMDRKNFAWTTTFNFTYNKNTIKHLYGEYDENGRENDDRTNGWFIGHSIGEIWDYKVIGIWQADEWQEAAKYGQQPGDPKVWNNPANDIDNGDGTTTIIYNDDDKVFLGQRTAPILMNMRNEFTIFKNLSIGFTLNSIIGYKSERGGIFGQYDAFLNQDNGGGFLIYGMKNQPWKEYWTIDNPSNKVGRINALGPDGATQCHWYVNRSFLRLENISIAYNFPKSITSKIGVSKLRVFANIQNLGTIHSADWYYGDPQNMSHATRTYNFGFNVTF